VQVVELHFMRGFLRGFGGLLDGFLRLCLCFLRITLQKES